MGHLKTKALGTNPSTGTPLETLTYDYNIRGWLLGANRDFAKSSVTMGNYFGFDLGYDKTNVSSSSGSNIGAYANPQFNGNIGGVVWKSTGDGQIRKYDYLYDNVNRLLAADFNQYTGSSFNKTANIDFSVKMGDGLNYASAYDANGNILSMNQMGLKVNGSAPIDQLTYFCTPNTNKLQYVVDGSNDPLTQLGDFRTAATHPQFSVKSTYASNTAAVNAGIIDYTYDANGNLTNDYNKAIVPASGRQGIVYNFLNLPQTITIGNKGTIVYTYDAAGNKLQKTTTENVTGNPAITTITTYLGDFVYQSVATTPAAATDHADILQYINHEEGRIRYIADQPAIAATSTSPAIPEVPASFNYDYFIKDHLGDVRMVLTEEQQSDLYIATMEPSVSSYEVKMFGNKITTTATSRPANFDSDPANTQVSAVNGTTEDGRVGPGVIMKVMAGDKFTAQAYAWYQNTGMNNNTNPALNAILNNLLAAFSPGITSSSAEGSLGSQVTTNTGTVQSGVSSFLLTQTPAGNAPRAYLNWVLLDEKTFQLVKNGNNSGFAAVPQITGVMQKQLLQANNGNDITITQNGYLYVYVSNESIGNVYFDNIRVQHTRGPLIEENHYYPFGLTMSGLSSKSFGKLENKFKYNGKELQHQEFSDGSGLEWYDYGARMYDAQIGRMNQVDPMTENFFPLSPYSYAANNPVLINDPTGKDWSITLDIDEKNNYHFHILFTGAVVDKTSDHKGQTGKLAKTITSQFQSLFNEDKSKDGKAGFTVDAKAEIRAVNSEKDIAKNETVFKIEDPNNNDLQYKDPQGKIQYAAGKELNGKEIAISEDIVPDVIAGNANKTIPHEIGHSGGLHHPEDDGGFFGWLFDKPGYGIERSSNNFMFAGGRYGKSADQLNKNPTGPTRNQLYHIYQLYGTHKLNRKDIDP